MRRLLRESHARESGNTGPAASNIHTGTAQQRLQTRLRPISISIPQLLLQRSEKFREGMGNGLRLRVTQNAGHKPKTRKGNQIMKNRNIQFLQRQDFSSRYSSVLSHVYLRTHPPHRAFPQTLLSRGTLKVRSFSPFPTPTPFETPPAPIHFIGTFTGLRPRRNTHPGSPPTNA